MVAAILLFACAFITTLLTKINLCAQFCSLIVQVLRNPKEKVNVPLGGVIFEMVISLIFWIWFVVTVLKMIV